MKKNAEIFLSKTLGADFIESVGTSLSKSEVYKQGTRTITDTNDLFQGLQIVPRALLSLLIRELSPMQIGDTKEVGIPGKEDTIIIVTKHERDSYSGQVLQNNVKINDFLHRSVPGLGLVLMTMLELYDVNSLSDSPTIGVDQHAEINRIIDERLNLHSLINKVVDGKMMQKDAVHQLLMSKLNELQEMTKPKEEPKPTIIVLEAKKKSRPLSEFVENKKKKILAKKEYHFSLEKTESIRCPDCWNTIFSQGLYSGCICFGDTDKKLHIKKSEDGYSVKFGRGWDADNIEMLLEVLRSKQNG